MYFLTGRRLAGCFWHIRGATRHLYLMKNNGSNEAASTDSENNSEQAVHCAQTVLEGIRRKTGIGDQRFEELSFIFDGGVGFSGGLCGAMVGAITGINLLLGMPVREMSYWEIIKGFSVGHANLLVEKPFGAPEPFMAGKQIIEKFKGKFGSFECSTLTGKPFSGWDEFQGFITEAKTCQGLMDFAVEEASEVIRQYK
ncbi:MAG: C-GCAxxG-C-C family (seleno)protein [Dissulfuribacterales bacterium]